MNLVRISTVCWVWGRYSAQENLKKALAFADQAGQDKADILCLPELFCARPGWKQPEPVPGPTTRALAAKAKRYGMYIICPVLQKEGKTTYNSAVLLDRKGKVAGVYHKHVPTIGELELGISPGREIPVFQTDFGPIGMAICFDLNFMDVAEAMRRQGVKIIFWASAFEGGTLLERWARHCTSFVVSSTHGEVARVVDISGRLLAESTWQCPLVTAEVNLERNLYHWDNTDPKVAAIKKAYGPGVGVEYMTPEGWIVLTSQKRGLTLEKLERQFKLERVDDYLNRARSVRDQYLAEQQG